MDFWALGVVIYQLILGETPFEHDEPSGVYERILHQAVSHIRHIVHGTPPTHGTPPISMWRVWVTWQVIAINQDAAGVQGAPIWSTCPPYTPKDNWWMSPW